MRVTRWVLIFAIATMLASGNSFSVFAAPPSQDELPLGITIMTVQVEAIAGAPMTWRVVLMPREGRSITDIKLHPGDARVWVWPDGVQTLAVLTNTVILEVPAVPLVSGDLTPTIEARYLVDKVVQTQLVTADASIQVEPIETQLEAGIIASQGTVRKKAPLPVEIWIHNRSPFTLMQVNVQGNGADLAWGATTTLGDILPGKIVHQVLTPTVVGEHPQPQLSIEYVWMDGTGLSHSQLLHVSGEVLALSESIFGRIPNELLGIVVGVVTGALASVIPGWVHEERSRKRQKEANRGRMHGLLRLMMFQSGYAADNGGLIDLSPSKIIFEEEGLFIIVEEDGLTQNVHDLLKAAQRYNAGLNLPGGAQRAEELRKAAEELGKKLDRAMEQTTR
jgi:hypothetical protein